MIDLNKEAEEYANYKNDNIPMEFGNENFNESVKSHFIAGHNSKATQAKILQAQIEILEGVDGEYYYSMSIVNKIKELQQQLKELENG